MTKKEEYFLPEMFWNYEYCNKFDFNDKTLAGYKSKGSINEDIENIYQTILKSAVHPSLLKLNWNIEEKKVEDKKIDDKKEEIKKVDEKKIEEKKTEEKNIEEIKPGDEQENQDQTEKIKKELIFNSIKIDSSTIKIMFNFLQKSDIVSIKLSNNSLTLKNLELIINLLITKPNNIYSFSFEWNDYLINEENNNNKMVFSEMNFMQPIESEVRFMKNFPLLFDINSKLESISFRGCFLGSEIINKVLAVLKNNIHLLTLNLYKNNLDNKCLDKLCDMFLFNRKLKEINLGGNLFNNDSIAKLKEYLGIYKLTDEEYESMQQKIEEIKQINEFNKKNHKNPKVQQKEVPFVDEIKDETNEETQITLHYKVRNDSIEKIDFFNSPYITQNSFENFIFMIDNTNNLILNLDLRTFDKDSVLKMIDINGKYCNRIFLCK